MCTSGFYVGDLVTLNATPAANFISWGGACSGSNAICTVSMDAAKAVTASFMVAPVIAGLPTTLTFALQNIGSTSAAQRATLTNTGSAALNITSISASGDYSVLDNCGAGIGAGGSCTMDVTFTPVVSGIRSGTLTLITDAPGGPHTVGLSGTGQGAVASLSVSSMTFVNQSQGTHSAAQTITLSNPGGAVLNFHIAVDGQFGVSNTTCGTILAMGDNCSIDVTFDPPSVGAFSGSLVISSDAVSSPNTVNLSGTGIAAPVVSLNPTSLIFAAQAVGSGTSQMVKLTNTGGAALTLSVAASGDFSQTS